MLATASAQVCVPLGHSSLYFTMSSAFLSLFFIYITDVNSISRGLVDGDRLIINVSDYIQMAVFTSTKSAKYVEILGQKLR